MIQLLASRKARRAVAAGVVATVLLAGGGTVAFMATAGWIAQGAAYETEQAAVQPVGSTSGPGCLGRILTTIRTVETNNRNLPPNRGGASGPYQFIDSTWQALARRAGVDVSLWPQAYLAPVDVQDQVAGHGVQAFLDAGNPVQSVPVYWYYPAALSSPALMDIVPMPEAGNVLTPRQYQARWMSVFAGLGSCPTSTPRPAPVATGNVNQLPPSIAGYDPGDVPLWALVEVQPGRMLAPEAAAAWRAMAAAAAADGVTLTITSAYRSLADQARIIGQVGRIRDGGLAADAGESPHQLAIATDMDVIPDRVFPWLVGNASRWCFGNLVAESVKDRERWHWAYYGHVVAMGCTPESTIG